MEELWWVPDPVMCAVIMIFFIFGAGPKTAIISIMPWLISLNLIEKYKVEGMMAFSLAGVVIGVSVGCIALPLLAYALHPTYAMITSLRTTSWEDDAFMLAMDSVSGLVGGLTYWWINWQDDRFRLK